MKLVRYLLFAALAALAGPVLAQTTTISALPAGSTLTGSEPIPMDQTGGCSGNTCRTSPAAIDTYVLAQGVPLTSLPAQASSTVLGNYSGSSAAPTALSPLPIQNMGNLVPAVSYVQAINLATLSGSQTLTLPTGGTVTSPNGASVLLVAQTTASQNGPWIINTSGAWTRPAYFPSGAVIPGNCAYLVLDLFTGMRWYENDVFGGSAVTIDTTAQVWTAISTVIVGGGTVVLKPEARFTSGVPNGLTLHAGDSFNATGAGTASGGTLNLQGGNASTTSTTGAANGGNVIVSAGSGPNTGSAGATNGGTVTFNGGTAGNSTTAAAGGGVTFTGGLGGVTANGAGGSITFHPGAGGGTGANGVNQFQDSGGNNVGSTTSAGITLQVTTVAALPGCGAGVVSHFAVSDATAATYHGALTGGGTVFTPVACINGTWLAD